VYSQILQSVALTPAGPIQSSQLVWKVQGQRYGEMGNFMTEMCTHRYYDAGGWFLRRNWAMCGLTQKSRSRHCCWLLCWFVYTGCYNNFCVIIFITSPKSRSFWASSPHRRHPLAPSLQIKTYWLLHLIMTRKQQPSAACGLIGESIVKVINIPIDAAWIRFW